MIKLQKKNIVLIPAVFLAVFLFSGCSNAQPKLPEKYIIDKEAFGNSIKDFGAASDITNGSGSNATDEQTKKVLSLTMDSIENSKKVSDDFLNYLNPDLKNKYHDYFMKSQQLYYEGLSQSNSNDTLESESVKKQIEAGNLMKEWLNWWGSNNKEILDKVFAG